MKQVLLVIDVQPCFDPPDALVRDIARLAAQMPTIATVERHDEKAVPFQQQHGWAPPTDEEGLVHAERTFFKHGYLPPQDMMNYLNELQPERVLVCGIQADTCVLAAGFALFDVGLQPTLLADLTRGSSLDRSGDLGVRLWRHHFSAVIEDHHLLLGNNKER